MIPDIDPPEDLPGLVVVCSFCDWKVSYEGKDIGLIYRRSGDPVWIARTPRGVANPFERSIDAIAWLREKSNEG